jgi:uncharacterized membrane protein
MHRHAHGHAPSRTAADYATLAAGAAVALVGLRRRDGFGAALAALGGGVVAVTWRATPAHFRHSRDAVIPAREGVRVDETIVVDRPVALVYRFWRRLENLPTFMRHLVSVRQTGELTSHWVARGPAGTRMAWDAEIINEVENELLAWTSLPGADVENAGSVHFTSANNGTLTVVHVELKYNPPAGTLGAAVARLFGEDPARQIAQDLRDFKRIAEEPDFSPEEIEVLKRYARPASPAERSPRLIRHSNEIIDETSEESFPASDVPSWGPRRGTH